MAEALWVPWILLPGQSTRTLIVAHLSIIFDRKQIDRPLHLIFLFYFLLEPTSNGHGLKKLGMARKIFVRVLCASTNMKPPE